VILPSVGACSIRGSIFRAPRIVPAVPESFEQLDSLPSDELRRRAFKVAARRRDVRFFWSLLEMVPAGEASEGRPEKLANDVESSRTWLDDFLSPAHPIQEAMRPVFIDYLEQHADEPAQ
jgi:hypothetical protein